MSPGGPGRDFRRFLRLPVLVAMEDDRGRTAYAINLSAGGICLQTREPFELGERLRLRFRLPGAKYISADAAVVWADCEAARAPGTGLTYCEVGLRFTGLGAAESAAIEEFVETCANFWPDDETGSAPPRAE